MSFNLQSDNTLIQIKLTDAGRRMLSLGKLAFKKAVLSDREIDYSVDRTGYYDILSNRILSPADYHPDIDSINLDGSNALTLSSQNVLSAKQFITGSTPSAGFFSGGTNAWVIESDKSLGSNTIAYASQIFSSTTITFSSSSYVPNAGELLFVPWVAPQGSSFTSSEIPSGTPVNCLWYRVASKDSSTTVTVDRPIPYFLTTGSASTKSVKCYSYPDNGIATYYGSGQTQNTRQWNMNIVRTSNVAGTDESAQGVSGYTRYGSIEYNGTKKYFGLTGETPAVGFIHYTNEFTGNTYAEQLIEKSVQMYLPMIMWHNIGDDNGTSVRWGASFYDSYGTTTYDYAAKSTYRELRDGVSSTNRVVGRIYHKLKLFVITDQELLTVLSYKSNRSYSLADYTPTLTTSPKYPLTASQANGLCDKDYDYFVTYIAENDTYSNLTSFGYPQALHCGYIKKIKGELDTNGNTQFLQLAFEPNSFPYMRNSSGIVSYGSGWNAQTVQILVNEQPSSKNYTIENVPSDSWKRISTSASGGNGIYRASDVSDTTIDPLKLNGYSFVISREDYTSGTTYTLNTGLTNSQSTLNFGYEDFFHGVIDAQIFATVYKSIITVYATNTQVNSSINSTFDTTLDSDAYISEVAILDDSNQVVAVAKPSNPIKKSSGKFLAFQLEIDF